MRPLYIVLHTAASRSPAPPAVIDAWHRERGFKRHASRPGPLRHIGYHHYIERDGTITPGREEDETGAHCNQGNMNNMSLGICLEGHGDHERWTPQQITALLRLLRSIYIRHPLIAVGGSSRLIGHREVAGVAKTCPGLLVDMDDVRRWYTAQVVSSGVRPVDVLPLQPMVERV
jgi:N-acetylmuramoyl-L-alanine amidase